MKKSNSLYIGISFVIMCMASIVLMGANWNGSTINTFKANKLYFLMMPVFFIIMIFAHRYESLKNSNSNYLKSLFFGNVNSDKKIVYLDYARVLAFVCVILNHTCSSQLLSDSPKWQLNIFSVVAALALVCNPLYIMLSGILLLSSDKEESLGSFYYNRFIKVVLPFIIYYLNILYMYGHLEISNPRSIGSCLKQILAGANDDAPSYWIIYIFISIYLSAPFIRIMIRNMNDKMLYALAFIIILMECVVNYLHFANIKVGISFTFGSWEGVFILGYILVNKSKTFMKNILCVLGLVSLFIISYISLVDFPLTNYYCYASPTSVFLATFILILLSKCENNFKKKNHYIISFFSKYSFVALLIHWYALFGITINLLKINPGMYGCIGGIFCTTLVAFLLSYILGFICENSVIISVRYILNSLRNKISKK